MNLRSKNKDGARVHMEALNDILFILLFFFMIIATLANPNVIPMANAKADSDVREKQNVVVSIDAGSNFYVGSNSQKLDINGLKINLTAELANNPSEEQVVVINSDSTARAADIVAVMRIARELKAKTVLAVAKP